MGAIEAVRFHFPRRAVCGMGSSRAQSSAILTNATPGALVFCAPAPDPLPPHPDTPLDALVHRALDPAPPPTLAPMLHCVPFAVLGLPVCRAATSETKHAEDAYFLGSGDKVGRAAPCLASVAVGLTYRVPWARSTCRDKWPRSTFVGLEVYALVFFFFDFILFSRYLRRSTARLFRGVSSFVAIYLLVQPM